MSATAELERLDLDAGFDPMARKKREPEIPKTLFSVKGVESWFDWLKRYAKTMDRSAMAMIDHALRNQAKADGFEEMPPRMGDE